MMRTPSSWSVAVRRPDGGVSCISNAVTSPASRRRWLRLPVIRGVVALGESLAIGFRALAISASVASAEEGEDGEVSGELTRGQLIFAFAMAIGFTVIVFKVSPALLTDLLPIHSTIVFVLVEGVIRVSLLIGYLALISLIPDLRRVFQYHAAEHKAINAYEDGAELTPERVQTYSKIHVRCGTAFLLWVMVIAVFVFALVGRPAWPVLIASRVLLLPVIAGLAYELIRFGGKHPNNRLLRTLMAPGLWLQGLTTREPTLDQVEVSINALQDVLAAEERSQAERGVSRVEVMA
ncbi:MAG: hypothetical protein QOI17_901 [Gaiellales bacterium]|nr:hypothetical protein [Gaiellales bacterium]